MLSGFLPACIGFCLSAAPAAAQKAPGEVGTPPPDEASATAAPLRPPPRPQYDLPPPGTRWSVLFTGLAVSAVSYGLALGAGYAWPDARTSDELKVPLVGPWMAIADTGCAEDDPGCSKVLPVVTAIFTGIDGVLQAGGLGIALESAFMPTASSKPRTKAAPTVRPVPYVAGRDGMGLGVVGTF
jgi:hypothetical protein